MPTACTCKGINCNFFHNPYYTPLLPCVKVFVPCLLYYYKTKLCESRRSSVRLTGGFFYFLLLFGYPSAQPRDCAMCSKSPCLSGLRAGRSGRKAHYGVHPNKESIAQCSEPHETMRMGFYYLKFLTAVFGLWF